MTCALSASVGAADLDAEGFDPRFNRPDLHGHAERLDRSGLF
jgi:hypothetical protein